jgi:hypothetical protein
MNTQTETTCDVLDTDEPEEKTEFTFDELDNSAKDRVREWHSERLCDYEWWDCCEEDFKQTAKEQGFDVDEAHFSLGYCQSDFASFNGSFSVEGKAAEDLLGETDLRRWSLIKADAALEHGIVVTLYIDAKIKDSFVQHFEALIVEEEPAKHVPDSVEEAFSDFSYEVELSDTITELARDISHDYYKSLREEYEYQTSDEAISKACEANEWLFDENGKLI